MVKYLIPVILIQAIFGLSGVCFVFFVSIFHYFRDRVDKNIKDNMSKHFSSRADDDFFDKIKDGILSTVIMKDFTQELFEVTEPRRRLRTSLLLMPIAGCMFLVSALIACISMIENEFTSLFYTLFENAVYFTLIGAFIFLIYGIYQTIRLARALA